MENSRFRLVELILVTSDPQLVARAELELSGLPLNVSDVKGFAAPTSQHYLIIVDARGLSEAERQRLRRIGPPAQKIAIDDRQLDNRLAKTFIPRDCSLRGVVNRTVEKLTGNGRAPTNPRLNNA